MYNYGPWQKSIIDLRPHLFLTFLTLDTHHWDLKGGDFDLPRKRFDVLWVCTF